MLLSALFLAFLFFILADFFKIFGTTEKTNFEIIELNFRMVNSDSGAPVTDVHVRCFQKGNNNACTEKESPGIGIVTVGVPINMIVTRSLLFNQETRVQKTADPKLHIMFIHNNYNNPVKTIMVSDVPRMSAQLTTVEFARAIKRE